MATHFFPKHIKFDARDDYALKRLSVELGVSEAQIVRWALRNYVKDEHWRAAPGVPANTPAIYRGHVDYGPRLQEVG